MNSAIVWAEWPTVSTIGEVSFVTAESPHVQYGAYTPRPRKRGRFKADAVLEHPPPRMQAGPKQYRGTILKAPRMP